MACLLSHLLMELKRLVFRQEHKSAVLIRGRRRRMHWYKKMKAWAEVERVIIFRQCRYITPDRGGGYFEQRKSCVCETWYCFKIYIKWTHTYLCAWVYPKWSMLLINTDKLHINSLDSVVFFRLPILPSKPNPFFALQCIWNSPRFDYK